MTFATGHRYARRLVAASFALALGVMGVTACGDDDSESIEVEDSDKVGERVSVTGEVDEVLSNHSFTLVGTKFTSLDELLVVSANEVNIEEDSEAEVTGILRENFDAESVRKEIEVPWKDDQHQPWNGAHYVQATRVER